MIIINEKIIPLLKQKVNELDQSVDLNIFGRCLFVFKLPGAYCLHETSSGSFNTIGFSEAEFKALDLNSFDIIINIKISESMIWDYLEPEENEENEL